MTASAPSTPTTQQSQAAASDAAGHAVITTLFPSDSTSPEPRRDL